MNTFISSHAMSSTACFVSDEELLFMLQIALDPKPIVKAAEAATHWRGSVPDQLLEELCPAGNGASIKRADALFQCLFLDALCNFDSPLVA